MKNKIKLPEMDAEKTAVTIGDFIVKETAGIGMTGAVIGLSGGVDSTTTAALAQRAFERYNKTNESKLELVGYILPSSINRPEDEEDGVKVAKQLGIRYEVIPIDSIVDAYGRIDSETLKSKFHKGNLMSEARALVLHRKAALEKKILLGTGNRDEDFGVGYYTLFGDGAVHVSPIGGLSKRLVKDMARYLGFGALAERTPTAGLEPGQTDFGDLGYEYSMVELVSEGIAQGFTEAEILQCEDVRELGGKQIAEYERAFGRKKFSTVYGMVEDIARRNRIAVKKAEIVHPPSPGLELVYE